MAYSSIRRHLPPATLAWPSFRVGALVWFFLRVCIGFPSTSGQVAIGTAIIVVVAAVVALVEARRHGDLLLLGNLGAPAGSVALVAAPPPLLLDLLVAPRLPDQPGILAMMFG